MSLPKCFAALRSLVGREENGKDRRMPDIVRAFLDQSSFYMPEALAALGQVLEMARLTRSGVDCLSMVEESAGSNRTGFLLRDKIG